MRTGLDPSAFLIVEWLSTGSAGNYGAPSRTKTPHRIKPLSIGSGESPEPTAQRPIPPSEGSEAYVIIYDGYDGVAHDKFIG